VVSRSVTVEVSQQRAFEVFTAKFGSCWPWEYSIGEADMHLLLAGQVSGTLFKWLRR